MSRVNRQCRRAAAFAQFRRVRFVVESPEKLVEDTERWTSILLANDGFRNVQKLTIQGDIYRSWRAHAHEQKPDADGRRLALFQYEDSFTPLARLLEQLPALKDLIYECESSFPSCLLLALHSEKLSACRLHVRNIKLRSLLRSTSDAVIEALELEPSELALATSPNLHAITLAGNMRTATGKADYHPEALLELVAWGNPSLKEVEYKHKRVKDTPALRRSGGRNHIPV